MKFFSKHGKHGFESIYKLKDKVRDYLKYSAFLVFLNKILVLKVFKWIKQLELVKKKQINFSLQKNA